MRNRFGGRMKPEEEGNALMDSVATLSALQMGRGTCFSELYLAEVR